MGGQGKSFPLQLAVNYWELEVDELAQIIREIRDDGARSILTWVPWSIIESDLQQKLAKFLSAVERSDLTVHVIPTLELGLNAALSGLPSDLLQPDRLARDGAGKPIMSWAPPQVFAVPSPFDSHFDKRSQSVWGRFQRELQAGLRQFPGLHGRLHVGMSGGLHEWVQGRDTSASTELALRRFVEDWAHLPEFRKGGQWGRAEYSDLHRELFWKVETEVQRARAERIALRNLDDVARYPCRVYAPELDPLLEGLWPSFAWGEDPGWLAALLERVRWICQRPAVSRGRRMPTWIHWLRGGAAALLTEPQRQQLLLDSVVRSGAQLQGGGCVWNAQEWLRFSPRFRARALEVAEQIRAGEIEETVSVEILGRDVEFRNLVAAQVPGAVLEVDEPLAIAPLIWVAPETLVEATVARVLLEAAQAGATVVLSERLHLTQAALEVLHGSLDRISQIELELGWRCKLFQFPLGRVVWIREAEAEAGLAVFAPAMLDLCNLKTSALATGGQWQRLDRGRVSEGARLWVGVNPRPEAEPVHLQFGTPACVRDLFDDRDGVTTSTLDFEMPAWGVVALVVEPALILEAKDGSALRLEGSAGSLRSQDSQASSPAQEPALGRVIGAAPALLGPR